MSDKWNKYESRYKDLALLAARKSITLDCKVSKLPAIIHQWNELSNNLAMGNIYGKNESRSSDFLKIWQCHRISLQELFTPK